MRFSLYTALIPFVAVLWSPCVAAAPVGSEDVEIETAHLKVTLPADGPGTVSWFGLRGGAA